MVYLPSKGFYLYMFAQNILLIILSCMKKIITATIASAIALSFPIALFAAGTTTGMGKPMPTTKMDTHVTDTTMVKKSEKEMTMKKPVKHIVKTKKSDTKMMKGTTAPSH